MVIRSTAQIKGGLLNNRNGALGHGSKLKLPALLTIRARGPGPGTLSVLEGTTVLKVMTTQSDMKVELSGVTVSVVVVMVVKSFPSGTGTEALV